MSNRCHHILRAIVAGMFAMVFAAGAVGQTEIGDNATYIGSDEFAKSLEQARAANNADEALAELADKVVAAGHPEAAIVVAVQIGDDRKRNEILAQQQPRGNQFGLNRNNGNGRGNRNGSGNGNGNGNAGAGGGSQADFDTLIDLITTTVSPESWEEVGGTGSLQGFPTGVLIDTKGLLSRGMTKARPNAESKLRSLIRKQMDPETGLAKDLDMRAVSLPRLETALMARRAAGLPPTVEMLTLAGLDSVEYVMLDAETHDVVLLGPSDEEGKAEPAPSELARLSDLVVLLHGSLNGDGQMVCSITPRQANLAATRAYLTETAQRALKVGERESWLATIRKKMGRQDIEYSGVDPETHVGQVLIAADYHMKLVGMGIEPSVDGVTSYLDSVELAADGTLPPMDVLRWWFTLKPAAVTTNPGRNTFGIPDDLVRVQSENEMLTDRGVRVHTGQSEPLNRKFASSFTEHYKLLAEKHPVYADLERVFKMAVAAAVISNEHLPDQANWQPTMLVTPDEYLVPRRVAAKEVDTIVTHRIIDERHVVAGISGGVDLAPKRDWSQPETGSNVAQLIGVYKENKPKVDRRKSLNAAIQWWW